MYSGDEEIIFLPGPALNSCDYAGTVSVADFMRDDAYCQRAPFAQGTRKKIGTVVELSGGRENTLAGDFRDVPGGWSVVQNSGDRSCGKPEMGGNRFESDNRFGQSFM